MTQAKNDTEMILDFFSIIENFNEGVRVADDNGIVLKVNDQFCKFVGKTREELENQLIDAIYYYDYSNPSELERHEKEKLLTIERIKNNKIIKSFEAELNLWNGKKVWFEISSSILTYKNRNYLISFFKEITEKKKFEKIQSALYKISEAANKRTGLQPFYKNIHEIVRELMPADNFYIALYNAEKNEVTFPYFVDEYDEAPEPVPLRKGLTDYIIRTGNPLLVTEDTEQILFEQGHIELIGSPAQIWLGVPLVLGGNVFGAIVVQDYHTDKQYSEDEMQILNFVSEQISNYIHAIQIQEEQKKSEAKMIAVWESSFDAMRILDKDGKIIMVNKAFCDLMKKTENELVGQFYHIFYQGSPDALQTFVKNFQNKTFEPHLEKKMVLWDGRTVWLELTNSFISINSQEEYLLSVARDVSQRKQLELDIINSEKKLRELNATKDVFFSIISHDLKGPFNSILGFTNVLANDIEALSKDQIKHFIGIISKTSNSLYNLLENLLQWSRIQTGKIENQPIKVLLKEKIDNVFTVLATNAIRKNITLDSNIPNDLIVFIDQNYITVILQNLVSNAIKFTPLGGKISVSATTHEDYAEIIVSDTGVGMDEEAQNNLFKLDKIRSTNGTDKETGTGLGLILCKQLVDASNGSIRVESKIKVGTSFIINIPIS